jgi:hypothetical protein
VDRSHAVRRAIAFAAMFPDFDFASLRPSDFVKEPSAKHVISTVNYQLMDMISDPSEALPLLNRLWRAMDAEIGLTESDVYSRPSDDADDPSVGAGTIWSFGYFFVNQRKRKIVYFACSECSRLSSTPIGFRALSSAVERSPSASRASGRAASVERVDASPAPVESAPKRAPKRLAEDDDSALPVSASQGGEEEEDAFRGPVLNDDEDDDDDEMHGDGDGPKYTSDVEEDGDAGESEDESGFRPKRAKRELFDWEDV